MSGMMILCLEPRSQLNQCKVKYGLQARITTHLPGPRPEQKDSIPPGLEEGKQCQ